MTNNGLDEISFLEATGTTPDKLKQLISSFPKEDPSDKDIDNARISYGYLRALYGNFPDAKLETLLSKDIGFSKKETKHLITLLTEDANLSFSLARTIMLRAKTSPGTISTAISDWRQTEEARDAVSSNISSPVGGVFEHFMKYLSDKLNPSVRAEICAKFDLYCKSGWAEKDFFSQKGDSPILNIISKWDEDLTGENLRKMFAKRFNQLFMDVRVTTKATGDDKVHFTSEQGESKAQKKTKDIKLAPPGYVDCVIPSPDGEKLFVGVVTTMESFRDGTQLERHVAATSQAVREGSLCKKAKYTTTTVSSSAELDVSVFHSSVVNKAGNQNKQFNKAVAQLTAEETDALNFLSFLSAGNTGTPREKDEKPRCDLVLSCRQAMVGALDVWNPDVFPKEERPFIAAGFVAKAINVIDRMTEKYPLALSETKGTALLDALNGSVCALVGDWATHEPQLKALAGSAEAVNRIYSRYSGVHSCRKALHNIRAKISGGENFFHEERICQEESEELLKGKSKQNKKTPN